MKLLLALIALFTSPAVFASTSTSSSLGLISSPLGILCIVIFVIAYAVVMVEEYIHLPKSKPVLFGAGLIWILVAYLAAQQGAGHALETVLEHNLLEYAALFLFLLVAMTRNVTSFRRCVSGLLHAVLAIGNFFGLQVLSPFSYHRLLTI